MIFHKITFLCCRTEQQKNSCLAEMNDMRAAVEEMNMEKATVEKQNKCLMNDIADANHRHEELQSAIGDADVTKKKLAAEKTDLDKQIADADATVRSLGKLRSSLSTQVLALSYFITFSVTLITYDHQ